LSPVRAAQLMLGDFETNEPVAMREADADGT
jgi:hypothetical protein